MESCVQNADVIVTATYATEPILKYGWVKYDAIINGNNIFYNIFKYNKFTIVWKNKIDYIKINRVLLSIFHPRS